MRSSAFRRWLGSAKADRIGFPSLPEALAFEASFSEDPDCYTLGGGTAEVRLQAQRAEPRKTTGEGKNPSRRQVLFRVYRVLQAVLGWLEGSTHRHARNDDATQVSRTSADGRVMPLCKLPYEYGPHGCVLSGVAPQDVREGRRNVVAQLEGLCGGRRMCE